MAGLMEHCLAERRAANLVVLTAAGKVDLKADLWVDSLGLALAAPRAVQKAAHSVDSMEHCLAELRAVNSAVLMVEGKAAWKADLWVDSLG